MAGTSAGCRDASPNFPRAPTGSTPTSSTRLKGHVWERIVAKHGLVPNAYGDVVASWQFMDYLLRYGKTYSHHSIVSTIQARQHGFHECRDTEEMFDSIFSELQAARILPA